MTSKMCTVLLILCPGPDHARMVQSASKVEVGEEARGVEHCNQQPGRTQPWHSESQVA